MGFYITIYILLCAFGLAAAILPVRALVVARDYVRDPHIRILPCPLIESFTDATRPYRLAICGATVGYSILASPMVVGLFFICQPLPSSAYRLCGWYLYGASVAAMTLLGPFAVALNFLPKCQSWVYLAAASLFGGLLLSFGLTAMIGFLELALLSGHSLHSTPVIKAPCYVVVILATMIGRYWRGCRGNLEQWLRIES